MWKVEGHPEPFSSLLTDIYDRSVSRGKKPSWGAREERRCKLFGSSARRVGLSAAVSIRE